MEDNKENKEQPVKDKKIGKIGRQYTSFIDASMGTKEEIEAAAKEIYEAAIKSQKAEEAKGLESGNSDK